MRNKILSVFGAIAIFLVGSIGAALAQSGCSSIVTGAVLTAAQWNACFAAKQNTLGYTPVNKAGDTMLGRLTTVAPTTLAAGFNLPPGTAPTSPNNGDLWTTSAGMFVRIAGSTVGPIAGGSALLVGNTVGAVSMYPAVGQGTVVPWPTFNQFGTAISTSGSTTLGFQETINNSFSSNGGELVIYGANKSGAAIDTFNGILNWPSIADTSYSCQGKKIRVGGISAGQSVENPTDAGAWIFRSAEMCDFEFAGMQTGSVFFMPTNRVGLDSGKTIVDSEYRFTTTSGIAFDLSQTGNTGIGATRIHVTELNAETGVTPLTFGFKTPSPTSGQNVFLITGEFEHLHGVGAGGTSVKLGDGAPAGGQVFGRSYFRANISEGRLGGNGVMSYMSNNLGIYTIDIDTPTNSMKFFSGACGNISIVHYNVDWTTYSDLGACADTSPNITIGSRGIGINNTAAPAHAIDVTTKTDLTPIYARGATSDVGFAADNTASGGRKWGIVSSATATSLCASALNFYDFTGSVNIFCITNSGMQIQKTLNVVQAAEFQSDVSVDTKLLFTNVVAPSTPASGKVYVYTDSTNKVLSSKNDAGTVSSTVVPSAAVSNQFMTGIGAAGVITRAQPAFTDLSGSLSAAQMPTQATNTVLGNATSGTAVPTALAVGSCSTAGSALIWTTNTGFGCNTSITAAAVPASGITGTTLASGVTASSLTSLGTITSLTATTINAFTLGGTIAGGGNQLNNIIIGTTTPLAGTFTTITGTSLVLSTTATGVNRIITARNLSNNSGAYNLIDIGNDSSATQGEFGVTSSTNTTYGAGGDFVLLANLGITIRSQTNGSEINFYTNSAKQVLIDGAGGVAFGAATGNGKGVGTINVATAIYANNAAGLSATKTVRASGGLADCTLIYTMGILTGGSC